MLINEMLDERPRPRKIHTTIDFTPKQHRYIGEYAGEHDLTKSEAVGLMVAEFQKAERLKEIKKVKEEDTPGKWLVVDGIGMCTICQVRAKLVYGLRYCPFCGSRVTVRLIRDHKGE